MHPRTGCLSRCFCWSKFFHVPLLDFGSDMSQMHRCEGCDMSKSYSVNQMTMSSWKRGRFHNCVDVKFCLVMTSLALLLSPPALNPLEITLRGVKYSGTSLGCGLRASDRGFSLSLLSYFSFFSFYLCSALDLCEVGVKSSTSAFDLSRSMKSFAYRVSISCTWLLFSIFQAPLFVKSNPR